MNFAMAVDPLGIMGSILHVYFDKNILQEASEIAGHSINVIN